jgi:hypothetical protein
MDRTQLLWAFLATYTLFASAYTAPPVPIASVLECKLQTTPGTSTDEIEVDHYGCIDTDSGFQYVLNFPDGPDVAAGPFPSGAIVWVRYFPENNQSSEAQATVQVVAWELAQDNVQDKDNDNDDDNHDDDGKIRRDGKGKGQGQENGGDETPTIEPMQTMGPTQEPTVAVIRGQKITAVVIVVRFVDRKGDGVGVLHNTSDEVLAAATDAVWGQASGLFAAHSYGYVTGVAGEDAPPAFSVDVPLQCVARKRGKTGRNGKKDDGDPHCPANDNYDLETQCTPYDMAAVATYARNKLAAEAELSPGDMFGPWTYRIYVMDHDNDKRIKCNLETFANTTCTEQWCESWVRSDYAHLPGPYVHNIGFNMGIATAGSTLGVTETEEKFGDLSGMMGRFCLPQTRIDLWADGTGSRCCNTRAFNAPHMVELGWVEPLRTLNNESFGNESEVTITLNSLSIDSQTSAGSGDDLPISTGFFEITPTWAEALSGVSYWVQFKTTHGYDATAEPAWLNNVQIKQWNRDSRWSGAKTLHLATLTPGDTGEYATWQDPLCVVRVTVNSINQYTPGIHEANITVVRVIQDVVSPSN